MKALIKVCDKEIRVTGRFVRMARLEADSYHFLQDPEAMLAALRKCGTRIDIFSFMQSLQDTQPKYPYPMEWDNLAALPVSTFDHWWNEQIGFKARNKAKQAEKRGVVIREVPFDDALVAGIREVYNESPVRHGAPNKHYGKSLETVHREEATFLDTSIFIGAYLADELIGFVKLVYDETKVQAGLMNIVAMIKHRDKAPTNALVAQAVRSCADRGISHLVYSRFAYGKKEQSTLTDFKERNGFQKVDLPRYHVGLTPMGRAALGLGLHHRLIDRLPAPLVAKVRDMRSAWYNRKLASVKEAV